jgi:hypothetical protein
MTDAERARWTAEFKRRHEAGKDAWKPRYLLWRWRLFWILFSPPFGWRLSAAWGYALSLCEQALADVAEGEFEEMPSPQDALDEDRQYWES